MKSKKKFRQIFFPITLLTIITFLSIIISIHALYIAFTIDPIYAAITIPITILFIILYIFDRFLIKRVSYFKLIIGEIILGAFMYFIFLYQASYVDINFYTNQDYILVIFDSNENSISKFTKKGVFGKELNVYNTNKIHLDKTMALRKNLRIKEPKEWKAIYYKRSKYELKGDSIEYIYSLKQIGNKNYNKQTDAYLDSLLKQEIK